jgi:hypothetical protein
VPIGESPSRSSWARTAIDADTVQVDLRGWMAAHPHLFADARSMLQASSIARAIRALVDETDPTIGTGTRHRPRPSWPTG